MTIIASIIVNGIKYDDPFNRPQEVMDVLFDRLVIAMKECDREEALESQLTLHTRTKGGYY